MPGYTKKNLKKDVENSAPKFDMPAEMEARFARRAIEGESLGLSHMKLDPNFRIPFGHKHEGQEEVYVIVRGSARVKVEDEIVELGEWDAIRFDMDTMRDVEEASESESEGQRGHVLARLDRVDRLPRDPHRLRELCLREAALDPSFPDVVLHHEVKLA